MEGAAIQTDVLDNRSGILCALAGPAGSGATLLLIRYLPELAVCGLIQLLYNLLPIYPLDGGRALRCILAEALQADTAAAVAVWVERLFLAGIFAASVFLSIYFSLGVIPVILAVVLILRSRNITCKDRT